MPSVESRAAVARADGAAPRARLRGATVILDERAVLRAVDLEVERGITLVRGPNGAGKTTALRALAGLLPLAKGTRELEGELLYLGHRPQLLHGLSPRENLSFFASFRGGPARIDQALARWGVAADADRPVERLSAGQRRRAALARLDAERCEVVLLDEPFAELDEHAAALLRRAVLEARDRGAAVVVASHGHAELDELAARVYAMSEGAATEVRER